MRACLRICIVLFLINTASARLHAEECLIVATDPNVSKAVSLFTPGIQAMFQKADICVNYIILPLPQIEVQMADGAIDGEYLRVKSYIEAMKEHVIAIPTPVAEGKGHLVTNKASNFSPKSLSDVGHKVIGYVTGISWHLGLVRKLKTPRAAKRYENLAKQLMKGRIDGFLIDELTLSRLMKHGLLPKDQVIKSPPIIDLSAYIVLHRKNSNYIPALDMALKQVKEQGGFKISK